ncbi:hypothetical protein CRG98_007732 [Punica granatum]|uniref:Uncharacterized protein n=1 Tax=Punica granatum TaxID=22663 RepID=A0A2I0KU71_PUNGR|nr:hypothetical protein CRG98_007732 [Punica granatum]
MEEYGQAATYGQAMSQNHELTIKSKKEGRPSVEAWPLSRPLLFDARELFAHLIIGGERVRTPVEGLASPLLNDDNVASDKGVPPICLPWPRDIPTAKIACG